MSDAKKTLGPIIATLRSSTCIFEVKCETSGEWISPAYNQFGYSVNKESEELKAWKERSLLPAYRHYRFKTEHSTFWIQPPIGFWIVDDGRLISKDAMRKHKIENVVPYYGDKEDVLARRSVKYILDGPYTFLPKKET